MADITKQLIIYGDDNSVLVSEIHLTKTIQHCFDILDRFYNYCNFNKVPMNPLNQSNKSFNQTKVLILWQQQITINQYVYNIYNSIRPPKFIRYSPFLAFYI